MDNLATSFPLIERMLRREEVLWRNEEVSSSLPDEITPQDVMDASMRLRRFAPYIKAVYPGVADGIIESPLTEINEMKRILASRTEISGRLFLKCDGHLPVSGSIKARGGIYEVLYRAEEIALESGLLKAGEDYSVLADERFRKLFSEYAIAVGSTGNLGLSIGIMSARLGFRVTVHMSEDARQWKKDMLREKGAIVVEHEGDFGKAVTEGRLQSERDSMCHFVDDENSKTLFLGYAVAGERLKAQLDEKGIIVDDDNPLFVYLPCGVGGGPGGVTYGLKQIFGKNVHCFFGEPVEAPAMLLGVMTGLHDKICAQDIGLTGKTVADGLAVSRPSRLVGRLVGNMLDGIYTVCDEKMQSFVKELYKSEGIFVEPSATAGFEGLRFVNESMELLDGVDAEGMKNATHIVWATGGSMVPQEEREKYLHE